MNQPTLFDAPKARATDPETSHRAARRVRAAAPSLESRILSALNGHPMTDDELCMALKVEVRRWPSVKTARSRLTTCDPPKIRKTGVVFHGQMVWKLVGDPWKSSVMTVEVRDGLI